MGKRCINAMVSYEITSNVTSFFTHHINLNGIVIENAHANISEKFHCSNMKTVVTAN